MMPVRSSTTETYDDGAFNGCAAEVWTTTTTRKIDSRMASNGPQLGRKDGYFGCRVVEKLGQGMGIKGRSGRPDGTDAQR